MTVDLVTRQIHDREELELLAALTEADARATSEKAWTTWRASLIRSLVRRASIELTENLIHGSDSPESAAREIALFFPGLT